MKFRENAIKPDMEIHCPTEEEAKILLEHLEELGYCWTSGAGPVAYFHDAGYYQLSRVGKLLYFASVSSGKKMTIEFSDLFEKDDGPMGAVEVLEWFANTGDGIKWDIFGGKIELRDIQKKYSSEEIIQKITAYEAVKKEKTVEVEWVHMCRIIRIQDNGHKKCVYEECLPGTRGCVDYYGDAGKILKKYISGHEGRFIAVTEDVCRVKGEWYESNCQVSGK